MFYATGKLISGLRRDVTISNMFCRSDEAYSKAAEGTANADGYKVIETSSDGITIAGQSAA